MMAAAAYSPPTVDGPFTLEQLVAQGVAAERGAVVAYLEAQAGQRARSPLARGWRMAADAIRAGLHLADPVVAQQGEDKPDDA